MSNLEDRVGKLEREVRWWRRVGVVGGLVGAFLVGGCASSVPVQIETDPPGAHVSVNGEYVGRSPVSAVIKDSGNVGQAYWATIEASPTPEMVGVASGDVLVRSWWTAEGLPRRVFFDMRQRNVTPVRRGEVDVRMENKP